MNDCTCPTCRHGRGEISDSEYAWYLKGCIETYATVPTKLLAKVDHSDREEHMFYVDVDIESAYAREMLQETIATMEKNGVAVDRALRHPCEYLMPKSTA